MCRPKMSYNAPHENIKSQPQSKEPYFITTQLHNETDQLFYSLFLKRNIININNKRPRKAHTIWTEKKKFISAVFIFYKVPILGSNHFRYICLIRKSGDVFIIQKYHKKCAWVPHIQIP